MRKDFVTVEVLLDQKQILKYEAYVDCSKITPVYEGSLIDEQEFDFLFLDHDAIKAAIKKNIDSINKDSVVIVKLYDEDANLVFRTLDDIYTLTRSNRADLMYVDDNMDWCRPMFFINPLTPDVPYAHEFIVSNGEIIYTWGEVKDIANGKEEISDERELTELFLQLGAYEEKGWQVVEIGCALCPAVDACELMEMTPYLEGEEFEEIEF